MKPILAGIGLFIASFVSLVQVAILAVLVKPQWFEHPIGVAGIPVGIPDSLAVASRGDPNRPDSAKGLSPAAGQRTNRPPDSTVAGRTNETNSQLAPEEAQVPDGNEPASVQKVVGVIDSLKMADYRAKAKLLESMDAESAAKILIHLEDGDVKGIIMSVKKRQAGKILGSMEPAHAARIMK